MGVSPDDVRQAVQRTGVESWFADDMANLHDLLASGYEDMVTDDVHTVTGGRRARLHSSPTTSRRPSPHTMQAANEADNINGQTILVDGGRNLT